MRRRVLSGLIAFPLCFVLAIASIIGYNMMAHRQAVFIESAWDGNITGMRITYFLGADVDAPSCHYNTCLVPIVAAGWGGDNDAILFLLDRGADVNGKMKRGQTALIMAASSGHAQAVRLLLAKGADVNAESEMGTALSFAREAGHKEIVEILLEAGAKDKSHGCD